MYHVRQQPEPIEEYLLIKFECDYGDEFDIEGFSTWKCSDWDKHVAELKNLDAAYFPVEWYFGTNEFCEFDSPSAVLSHCKITKITKSQYDTFQNCFCNGEFGKLPCLNFKETDWCI